MSNFSTFLNNYLQRTDMAIPDLAAAVGVSEITVEKWLRGRQYPLPKHVFRLSLTTGKTTVELAEMVIDANDYASQLSYAIDLIAYAYGKSRSELSAILGIGVATIAHWKKDIGIPNILNIGKLNKVFDWSPDYIMHLSLNTRCKSLNMQVVARAVGSLHTYCTRRNYEQRNKLH